MAAIEHPARQILVATDFSDSAEVAFATAVDYARALHARLHVLNVFAPTDMEVTRRLADAVSKAGPDVPVAVASAAGDPAQEILKYSTRHPIGLIVMGTHGRTGLSRVLLGSVADRVIRGGRMSRARGAHAAYDHSACRIGDIGCCRQSQRRRAVDSGTPLPRVRDAYSRSDLPAVSCPHP